MLKSFRWYSVFVLGLGLILSAGSARAQLGNSGSIEGVVKDPSGSSVPGAKVEITNPVSGFHREATTDTDGAFRFTNVPFNPYHLVVTASGFDSYTQDVEVRSTVPFKVQISLKVGSAAATSITVEANAGDLIETESTFHTDVDQAIIDRLPLESASSSVINLVTLVSPGAAADSNGNMHGLGDHAENSFSVDGQPITDQTSKVFSNQIPSDSIQSLEVISGAPPAEFGDKTSLVVKVTTKSGLGVSKPTGVIYSSYGSFGTVNAGFDLAYGNQKWGNFIAANALRSGRFLDPPEFTTMHDKGNLENIFDRVDYQLTGKDTIHANFQYTRSWFQTPNTFDNLAAFNGNPAGDTDERSKIGTFNIAPVWTRLISPTTVFTLGAFVRRDQYNYYPSPNPLADLGPINTESISQDRKLTNAGLRSDISYVKGIHNVKAGVTYEHTFLTENDQLGIVDPTLLPSTTEPDGVTPCFDPTTNTAVPGSPCAVLLPFDLTRGGTFFRFHGHADVKEIALYVQDVISKGNWSFNLGIRGDIYRGLSSANQAEPRLGVAYNIKPSNTVLRISYARTLETPFNENLVISSTGCNLDVIAALIPCVPASSPAGFRNEFHAGLQQAVGKYLVVDGEYIWKYTHNAYDFSVLGNTPVTFPIDWHNSKIPGWLLRASVPNFHGFSALVVMSSVAARYFPPQVGGLGVTVGASGSVFRIDHDEKFNQTTHLQYQPWKLGPWLGFNWRYDSGLVAGALPCASCGGNGPNGDNTTTVDTSTLTPDQQFEAGLFCGTIGATPTTPISSSLGPNLCPATQYHSSLVSIPKPGTENDDKNPPRIAPRNLFDIAVGDDNLFHGDRYRWSLRFSTVNLTNKKALYNFLSTFSGTHYVTPRAETVELGFHF